MRTAQPVLRRLLVVVVFAFAGLGLVPGPATAASGYCSGSGVDVVVDFGTLPGGVVKGCGHGSAASDAFTSAGFALTDNPRMGDGYVCTVRGEPANRACTGTTSYWALFVSTDHRTWTYASLGAYSQAVHDGESVAFSWQSSSGNRAPRAAPAPARVTAPPSSPSSPKSVPTPQHTKSSPAGHGSEMHAAASSTPSPTPSPRTTASAGAHVRSAAHASHRTSASASPSAAASSDTATASSASGAESSSGNSSSSGGSGLPWWIPVGVVAVLAGGAGVLTWRRRHVG